MTNEQFEKIMESLDLLNNSLVKGFALLARTICLVHGVPLDEEKDTA